MNQSQKLNINQVIRLRCPLRPPAFCIARNSTSNLILEVCSEHRDPELLNMCELPLDMLRYNIRRHKCTPRQRVLRCLVLSTKLRRLMKISYLFCSKSDNILFSVQLLTSSITHRRKFQLMLLLTSTTVCKLDSTLANVYVLTFWAETSQPQPLRVCRGLTLRMDPNIVRNSISLRQTVRKHSTHTYLHTYIHASTVTTIMPSQYK